MNVWHRRDRPVPLWNRGFSFSFFFFFHFACLIVHINCWQCCRFSFFFSVQPCNPIGPAESRRYLLFCCFAKCVVNWSLWWQAGFYTPGSRPDSILYRTDSYSSCTMHGRKTGWVNQRAIQSLWCIGFDGAGPGGLLCQVWFANNQQSTTMRKESASNRKIGTDRRGEWEGEGQKEEGKKEKKNYEPT